MDLFLKKFHTPLGQMIAVATETHLISLDFEDSKYIDKNLPLHFSTETNAILDLTEKEIQLYFKKELQKFSIPLQFSGTDFQKKVWNELLKIPYGATISYQKQSENLGNPLAIRAVAQANSKNKIAIIIPCHRVIGKNKKLTGYAGGLDKKDFLLQLEKLSNSQKTLFDNI